MAKTKSLKLKEDFKKIDKILLIFTILLFLYGLFMIFSASNVALSMKGLSPFTYVRKQALFLFLSLIPFIIFIKCPSKYYYVISIAIGLLLLGLLIYLPIFGDVTRGAKSWIDFGPISIQPSEFIKIFLIMFFGTYYEKYLDRCKNSWIVTLIPVFLASLVFGLIFLQPDLGTAIIIFIVVALLFISIPIDLKKRFLIGGVGGFIIGIALLLLFGFNLKDKILSQTQLDRFNFKDPCSRYTEPTGYQLCNGFIAMNNGGFFGTGVGNSTQKYLYLPEPHNDFIMVIIVEENGALAFLIIMAIYVLILSRVFIISKNASNLRNSIIGYGIMIYIFAHIVVNLGGVFGLFPMTGVPLPFLSYGGSSALTLVIALGIVQRIKIESYDHKRKIIFKEGKNI